MVTLNLRLAAAVGRAGVAERNIIGADDDTVKIDVAISLSPGTWLCAHVDIPNEKKKKKSWKRKVRYCESAAACVVGAGNDRDENSACECECECVAYETPRYTRVVTGVKEGYTPR